MDYNIFEDYNQAVSERAEDKNRHADGISKNDERAIGKMKGICYNSLESYEKPVA